MDLRKHSTLTRLLTLVLSALLPAAKGEAQSSGKVGAVNQDATGTPPGGASRTLVVGAGVVFKERVKTSAQGSAQILFPDQSTLNVGRNSTLVIDEYVYNPKSGNGTMTASLGKGALRLVGGQISHNKGATVNTPVASLGIRGGIASVTYPITPALAALDPSLSGSTGELVIGHVGTLVLKNKVSEVTIRPGFAAIVNGPNVPISEPFRVPEAVLASVADSLTSGPGQNGGAVTEPAEPFISRNEVGTTILADPAHPPGTDPLGYTSIFGAGDDVARSRQQTNQTQNTVTPAAPPPYGAQ